MEARIDTLQESMTLANEQEVIHKEKKEGMSMPFSPKRAKNPIRIWMILTMKRLRPSMHGKMVDANSKPFKKKINATSEEAGNEVSADKKDNNICPVNINSLNW